MNRSEVQRSVSRVGGIAVSLLAGWGLLAAGCGKSASESSYCDETGCYVCDGYGCNSTTPPGGGDASVLGDSGASAKGDASAKTDAAADAHADGAPTCGGNLGPCPCTTSANCTGAQVCAGGLCTDPTNACVYTSECPANDQCDNGQCVPSCTSSASCPTGLTCTKGVCVTGPATCTSNAQCTTAGAPYCISGQCAQSCTADSQCAAGDYCDQGACLLDTRPQPNCKVTADCNQGDAGTVRVCLDGYCKYECGSASDCTRVSAFLSVCGTPADAGANACTAGAPAGTCVCWSPNEATPACTTADQCKAGQDCISNTCQ